LLAAKVANAFSGPEGKMGVVGRGKQLYQGAMGLMTKRAAAAGGMDYFAAREAAGGMRLASGVGKAAGSGIGMFETVGGPLVRILGTVVGRLGVLGIVVTLVITAFNMLRNNVWGFGDAFKKSFGGIVGSLASSAGKLMSVLGKLWDAIQPIMQLFGGALLLYMLWFMKGVELLARVISAVASALIAITNALIWLLNKIPGVNIGMVGAEKAAKAAAENKAENRAGEGITQDFRGSKFEITNNFPQGIDGGRVAVAFGDDLAKLGERRLDSGLRPLYSIR
jgi:hypothetical protein